MPVPLFCSNPDCPNHTAPAAQWFLRHGSYRSAAHGSVQRYRCRRCGRSLSDQTESIHYFAKRRLPLSEIWESLLGGASMRELARRYRSTPMAIQYGILRLGRQAMASHLKLLSHLAPRPAVVFDGLRSFLCSQDHPCELTTVVERSGEVILSIAHTVSRRGGAMRPAQRHRVREKALRWRPEPGSMRRDIAELTTEIWDYLRPLAQQPALIDTDKHPLYRRLLAADPAAAHFRRIGRFQHRRTSSTAPRRIRNPLFPVNYIDRLLRHRLREHTRETLAFGRHAAMQMHRGWIFACDHNTARAYRVKRPHLGVHALQGAVPPEALAELTAEFFQRRIRLRGVGVPGTIQRVWLSELATPPVRWRVGQRGTSVRIPAYARRDLAEGNLAYQHGF